MRIAVLSDTHIPINAQDLPREVYEGIAGVDMILHAGDIVEIELLEKLSKIAPVRAVCGNMDGDKVRSRLPKKDVVKVGSVSIGLTHGWGAPADLPDIVAKEFTGVDAIIFGHSHQPLSQTNGGVLFFNPGSPTDKVFAPYRSYGMLEIDGKKITPKLITL